MIDHGKTKKEGGNSPFLLPFSLFPKFYLCFKINSREFIPNPTQLRRDLRNGIRINLFLSILIEFRLINRGEALVDPHISQVLSILFLPLTVPFPRESPRPPPSAQRLTTSAAEPLQSQSLPGERQPPRRASPSPLAIAEGGVLHHLCT